MTLRPAAPSISLPEAGLRDGSVELRPVSGADVPAFVEALQDPAIAEGVYHGKLAPTEQVLRPYLQRNAERMRSGAGAFLGVWEADAERLSGETMLFDLDWTELTAEVGFWIAPGARGRGLIGPVLKLTLELAFDHLGLERVCGLTGVDNLAAHRAMERAGLRREGVLRGVEKAPSGRLDQMCFAILAGDARRDPGRSTGRFSARRPSATTV